MSSRAQETRFLASAFSLLIAFLAYLRSMPPSLGHRGTCVVCLCGRCAALQTQAPELVQLRGASNCPYLGESRQGLAAEIWILVKCT